MKHNQFIFRWVLLSILLGIMTCILLNSSQLWVQKPRWETVDFALMITLDMTVWPLAYLTLGVAQFFLLKSQIRYAGWWIMTPLIGSFLGGFLAALIIPSDISLTVSMALTIGFLQWMILKKSLNIGSIWFIMCLLGGLIAGSLRSMQIDNTGLGSLIIAKEVLCGVFLYHKLRQSPCPT